MTPFSADALLAVLQVFYTPVSAATLARAFNERPAYFAGGCLGGDSGTLLILGDGRVFALIDPSTSSWRVTQLQAPALIADSAAPPDPGTGRSFDPTVILAFLAYWSTQPGVDPSVGSDPNYWLGRITQTGGLGDDNQQYWIDRFHGIGGDTPDGLALEPGPLTAATFTIPGSGRDPQSNETLVSDQLGALDGAGPQLDSVAAVVTANDPAAAAAALNDSSLDDASAANDGGNAATQGEGIDDIAGATTGQRGAVNDNRSTYNDDPPPDLTPTDPGPPPERPGPGEPGGPPAA